jgi:hypothetical protein
MRTRQPSRDIHRIRQTIRSTWSDAERDRRRQIAARRQRALLRMLQPCPTRSAPAA